MLRVAVDMGGRARVVCSVARTALEQAHGLQGHSELREGEGMLFSFFPPRAATFHQGTVAFPIDLVFADASGVVGRIVHGTRPGTKARWTHPIVGAVVEVSGGACARMGLAIGDTLRIAGQKLGAQTYNLLRTLTEASMLDHPRGPDDRPHHFDVHADPPPSPLHDGHDGKEPHHVPPDFSAPHVRRTLIPPERWNDRALPDEDPETMDGTPTGWAGPVNNRGWGESMGPIQTLDGEADYAVRNGQQHRGEQVDLPALVSKLMAGAQRVGVPWESLALNPKRERAVITPTVVGTWLHALGLGEDERSVVHDAATSSPALDALGTGFIAEHLAETANLAHAGTMNILVVTRQKRNATWT